LRTSSHGGSRMARCLLQCMWPEIRQRMADRPFCWPQNPLHIISRIKKLEQWVSPPGCAAQSVQAAAADLH
jgi:hypothetical protein